MRDLAEILEYLNHLAPLALAEEWDNVGLLLGSSSSRIDSVLTCLTLTHDVAAEAIEKKVGLIVSHHPILFRPINRLTDQNSEGAMLRELIRADIAVYSPHTAYDSAAEGINAQLANLFDLSAVCPIRTVSDAIGQKYPHLRELGAGRIGQLPAEMSLGEFADRVAAILPGGAGVQIVGESNRAVQKIGIACGSAAEFLHDARRLGAEVLLTGEARFHACLEARERGIALVVAGHYATERLGIEHLAELIENEFPTLKVAASKVETDPLQFRSKNHSQETDS